MAVLPVLQRLSKEVLQEAPAWIDRLIQPLNVFMENIYYALNHGLTLSENMSGTVRQFQVTGGASATDVTYSFPVTQNPLGLVPMKVLNADGSYTAFSNAVFISWNYINGKVVINAISGLTNGTKYNFTVFVFYK